MFEDIDSIFFNIETTFPFSLASILSILRNGFKPILVEPDLATYNIDINNYQSYSEKVDKLMETNSSDALKLCLYYNFKKIVKKARFKY